MIRRSAVLLALFVIGLAVPAAARADFGFVPGSTKVTAVNRDGTVDFQAGSHPFSYTFEFELNTDEDGEPEGGEVRDIIIEPPPGLVGNLEAVPTCPQQSFEGGQPKCLPSTQVGVLRAIIPGFGLALGPVYNLEPPPGVVAQLGFSGGGGLITRPVASVRTEEGYGVSVLSSDLPVSVVKVEANIWGVPADSGHTPERGPNPVTGGFKSEAPLLPFLTLPTSCAAPPELTVKVDSRQNPGVWVAESVPTRDKGGNAVSLTGCETVPFSPTVLAAPSTGAADTASGLGFELQLPDQGLLNPSDEAVAETQPVKTEVTLPAGITANPAAAGGLGSCTFAQYKAASVVSGPGQGCPESSKLGTLIVHTPLIDEAVEGSLYLAEPHNNPFGSLVALYVVAKASGRGVLAKQAGEVRIDPTTGQLTTIIDGLPPVPYSSFRVQLREGPRAPLITPRTCGTYTTTAKLYPFSNPGQAVVRTAPFTISGAAAGGPCAPTESQLPNKPTIEAGALTPLAATYSPFVFKVSRNDGDQLFSSLTASPPKGLLGKLKGIPYCPDAAIAAAAARTQEGTGAVELASPSCPGTSQVGIVNAGAGAGSSPLYVQGKVYLAGPYKGAPLSLAIITPAIAGPFDLGVVVVRAAIFVNETTGQITVQSDPLPTMLQGIPLDIRSAAVRMDREDFTLNPTNCEPLAITGALTSTIGSVAPLSTPFQVGGCKGLDFSPKLSLKLSGGTTRAKHPALRAVLTQPAGQANLARFSLTLPPTEFVDPNHVANPCTRPQFAAGACPSSSVLGKVKAFTPLLDKPLEGLIYFRANGGERELPDAVADLKGQVHLISVGFVDAVHKKGSEESRIRTTIATVPDAPISKVIIELKGGKKHGLLVNSANICKTPNRAMVKMKAQNGLTHDFNPKIAVSCGKKK